MAVALVGTIGAVSLGATGASVTPAFGTSETRAAGHMLICWCDIHGVATLPGTPMALPIGPPIGWMRV